MTYETLAIVWGVLWGLDTVCALHGLVIESL
jgi:hypothetical protein